MHNILCGGRVDLVYEHCVLHIKYYAPIIEKRVTLSIKKEHTAVVTESVTMSESFIVTDYVTSSRVDLYFIDPLWFESQWAPTKSDHWRYFLFAFWWCVLDSRSSTPHSHSLPLPTSASKLIKENKILAWKQKWAEGMRMRSIFHWKMGDKACIDDRELVWKTRFISIFLIKNGSLITNSLSFCLNSWAETTPKT